MYRTSVVGIDNTGKTSVVRALDGIDGINTVHLTDYHSSISRAARITGNPLSKLAQFGEQHNLGTLTGSAYLMHLAPCFFEERAMRRFPLVVSDRDPIVDTICYSDFYLHNALGGKHKLPLRYILEHIFSYPNLMFHLEASPEMSVKRNETETQLHEQIEVLEKLRDLFDKELSLLEQKGIKVIRIDTDTKPLEEVTEEVAFYFRSQ